MAIHIHVNINIWLIMSKPAVHAVLALAIAVVATKGPGQDVGAELGRDVGWKKGFAGNWVNRRHEEGGGGVAFVLMREIDGGRWRGRIKVRLSGSFNCADKVLVVMCNKKNNLTHPIDLGSHVGLRGIEERGNGRWRH